MTAYLDGQPRQMAPPSAIAKGHQQGHHQKLPAKPSPDAITGRHHQTCPHGGAVNVRGTPSAAANAHVVLTSVPTGP